jgi:hypothetical protein
MEGAVEVVIDETGLLKASRTLNVRSSSIKVYVTNIGRIMADASVARKPVLAVARRCRGGTCTVLLYCGHNYYGLRGV